MNNHRELILRALREFEDYELYAVVFSAEEVQRFYPGLSLEEIERNQEKLREMLMNELITGGS